MPEISASSGTSVRSQTSHPSSSRKARCSADHLPAMFHVPMRTLLILAGPCQAWREGKPPGASFRRCRRLDIKACGTLRVPPHPPTHTAPELRKRITAILIADATLPNQRQIASRRRHAAAHDGKARQQKPRRLQARPAARALPVGSSNGISA